MFYSEYFESHPVVFALLLVWSIFWKGLSMWKAAHQEQKYWFIALLVLNTAGILDIFYLYILPRLNNLKKKEGSEEESSIVVEPEVK